MNEKKIKYCVETHPITIIQSHESQKNVSDILNSLIESNWATFDSFVLISDSKFPPEHERTLKHFSFKQILQVLSSNSNPVNHKIVLVSVTIHTMISTSFSYLNLFLTHLKLKQHDFFRLIFLNQTNSSSLTTKLSTYFSSQNPIILTKTIFLANGQNLFLKTAAFDLVNQIKKLIEDLHLAERKGENISVILGNREQVSHLYQILKDSSLRNIKFVRLSNCKKKSGELSPDARVVYIGVLEEFKSFQTSLVGFVIDSLLMQIQLFDQTSGQPFKELTAVPHELLQRWKFACTERSDVTKVFHMCTKEYFDEKLKLQANDMINLAARCSSDTSPLVLWGRRLSWVDLLNTEFFFIPGISTLEATLQTLFEQQVFDKYGNLTPFTGLGIVYFATNLFSSSRIALLLLSALNRQSSKSHFDQLTEETFKLCAILECLSSDNYIVDVSKVQKVMSLLGTKEGDFLTLLNIFEAFSEVRNKKSFCIQHGLNLSVFSRAAGMIIQIRKTSSFFLKQIKHQKNEEVSRNELSEEILNLVYSAFYHNLAKLDGNGYRLVKGGKRVKVHPTSGYSFHNVLSPYLIFFQLRREDEEDSLFIASKIRPKVLLDVASHHFREQKSNPELVTTTSKKKRQKMLEGYV
eukprot:snap_masked-scaffold_37-processed-gene-1.21-mRNA-1 protein AED:1.00 eAED:1.00 QI:0/-1/0/0/-1/1/1/0/634